MSESPKKIWVDKDELGWPEADEFYQRMQTRESKEYGIPYIRADLVDELVEALEMMIIGSCACGIPHAGERAVLEKAVIHARTVLAKARGEG